MNRLKNIFASGCAGLLLLGNAGALPKGTALTLGGSGTAGILDLAGYNAQVSGLASGGGPTNRCPAPSVVARKSALIFEKARFWFIGFI